MHQRIDHSADNVKFQSAPGREAGRCPKSRPPPATPSCFNPRPAVRPGDAAGWEGALFPNKSFNPRPAVRPGDARPARQFIGPGEVSIRARP